MSFLLFFQASVVIVKADEIHLNNGDRITGDIITMEDGKLIISTSYAGEISVTWAEVVSLKSDDTIRIILSDETDINGITGEAGKGKLRLRTDNIDETVSFDLAEVKSINPPTEPVVKLKGHLNIGLTSSKGNTENESQHLDGEFVARTEKNRYTVGAEINRADDDGEQTVNNSVGYLKYDHFMTDKYFVYSNAFFEKDKFKDLNLRTALGLGAGYQFLEKPLINLSIEGGLAYINEDLENDLDEDYQSARWALNFDKYLLDKAVQFFHFHEGFLGFEEKSDLFIRSRTGFRLPIYKAFNATLQFNYDWDKMPAAGREKSDIMYIFNLGYQFDN
jgi:putative salt-induced outer membrane protein YdiY